MSLDMDMDLQDRRADAAALDMDIDFRDRRTGPADPDMGLRAFDRLERPDGAVPLDPGFEPHERPDDAVPLGPEAEPHARSGGEVSLDRLVDVINDVLAVPPSEGLALLVQTQLARAAAPERGDPDVATLPEDAGTGSLAASG
jgi:hypothetical protein